MIKGISKGKALIVLLFDMSGPTASEKKTAVKNIVKSLLLDAALNEDKLSFVSVHGRFAKMIFGFTSNLAEAEQAIEEESFGGTTPLASGLFLGLKILQDAESEFTGCKSLMVICSKGDSNVPIGIGANIKRELDIKGHTIRNANTINSLFIDIGERGSPAAQDLAKKCGSRYLHTQGIEESKIYEAIKKERDRLTILF